MNCKLYTFFKAVRGNWRNAVYVSCDCAICPYGYAPACKGFLLAANEDGYPMLLLEHDFATLSNEVIDSTECWSTISREAFESMYALFLQWHMENSGSCPLRILSRQMIGCCQNQ